MDFSLEAKILSINMESIGHAESIYKYHLFCREITFALPNKTLPTELWNTLQKPAYF